MEATSNQKPTDLITITIRRKDIQTIVIALEFLQEYRKFAEPFEMHARVITVLLKKMHHHLHRPKDVHKKYF